MKGFILVALAVTLTTATLTAQTAKEKVETNTTKTKVKPTSTIGQKAHNVVRRHHKHTSGVKYKRKNKLTNKKTKVEVKND